MRKPAVVVLGLLAGACASGGAGPRSVLDRARGHLLIVGGGPQPEAIRRRFVELAGGDGSKILVFPMASSAAEDSGRESVEVLRGFGADARSVVLSREEAMSADTAALFAGVRGIWFPGGDQSRITTALQGTPVEAAIREHYRAGAVVGGTSAGAAVMSNPMITGEERRPGGSRPPRDSSLVFLTIERGNVVTAPGFGLIAGAIVDQHFVRRRRHNRLLSLVLENPELIGVGIDESTALEVGPDGRWRVLGESVAVVYDAREARITPDRLAVLGAAGVRVHVLPAGAVYDPRGGQVTLPTIGAPRAPTGQR